MTAATAGSALVALARSATADKIPQAYVWVGVVVVEAQGLDRRQRRFGAIEVTLVLDTRQVGMALRRLRRLGRHGARSGDRHRLDDRATIITELDLIFAPPVAPAPKFCC